MCGVGDYEAGELAVMEDGGEKKLDCKDTWVNFNGKTTLHRSCESRRPEQTRFTLQFYEHGEFRHVRERPMEFRAKLKKLGFPVERMGFEGAGGPHGDLGQDQGN